MKLKLKSNVMLDTVHGGYDDAASLTLWLDPRNGEAQLNGHSGSSSPLDGDMAPDAVPCWEAIGKSGYIVAFDESDIAELVSDLEPLLQGYLDGEDTEDLIQERLDEVDLAQESYRDWTAENEIDTHNDLYDA